MKADITGWIHKNLYYSIFETTFCTKITSTKTKTEEKTRFETGQSSLQRLFLFIYLEAS